MGNKNKFGAVKRKKGTGSWLKNFKRAETTTINQIESKNSPFSTVSEKMAEILRISSEKTLELIQLYEQEQCLWNTDMDEYKSRDKRAAAAQKIPATLNIEHFEAKHVMIKFKNLRSKYGNELRKIAQSRESGDVNVYQPKVFWFKQMDSFLRPHLQPPRTYQIPPVSDNENASSNDDENDDDDGEFLVEIKSELDCEEWEPPTEGADHQPTSEEQDPLTVNNASFQTTASTSENNILHEPPSKRPRVEAIQSLANNESSTAILQTMCTHLATIANETNDPSDMFAKYVASLLKQLPLERSLQLQPKIIDLIMTELKTRRSTRN